MPPVCPCFTRPAQKKCRYAAAVLDIEISSLPYSLPVEVSSVRVDGLNAGGGEDSSRVRLRHGWLRNQAGGGHGEGRWLG